MSGKPYEWERYWIPRGGAVALDLEGFLEPPPGAADWSWQKNDIVRFEEIADTPCLVMLGEPGIGKSFALKTAFEHVRILRPSGQLLFCNLGAYGDEKLLAEDVFESKEFQGWASNGGELHVFLDSFDECLLRVDALGGLLGERIKRLQTVEGLFFRIASRTAEWRTGLEESLKHRWGDDRVGVYELAPLTKSQVQVAASAHTPDPDKFMQEIIAREVVSFGTKPLTLDLLLRIWKAGGGALPLRRQEIYEHGCLELCSEANPHRDTPRLRRELAPEQRLAVASQIAAATVFCKRSAVWIGNKPSQQLPTDISRSGLAHGCVVVKGQDLMISDKGLREALDTGLFTARGADRLGWAHQTYAEYLAARYVQKQQFTTHQVLDLILHPSDQRLIPQLQEVASWIAANDKSIFQRFIDYEPDTLLRSDVAALDNATKAKLVASLLSASEDPGFRADFWALRKGYSKLKHPKLTQKLRAILLNKDVCNDARVEAAWMIEACELLTLLQPLSVIALDAAESHELRATAAEIVLRLGDTASKRALKPLALGERGPDVHDQLRTFGLRACWPSSLTPDEVFASLKEPDDASSGSYSRFLTSELVEHLSAADFPRALQWVTEQQQDPGPHSVLRLLMRIILDRAALHLQDSKVLVAFAPAILTLLRKHDFSAGNGIGGLTQAFELHPELRRKVVEAMLTHFQDANVDSLLITRWGVPFVKAQDLDWLLSRIAAEMSIEEQRKLAHLISCVFLPNDAKQIDSVITVSQVCPVLIEVLAHWLKPLILGSEEAIKAKRSFEDNRRWTAEAAQRQDRPGLNPPPAEHIRGLLERYESGETDAWWQICAWAELKDDGAQGEKFHHIDLHDLPGWEKATPEIRTRLVAAANGFVTIRGPNIQEWFHWQGKTYRPAVAGVRALLLLATDAPARYEDLPQTVWRNWLPAILRLHPFGETAKYHELVTKCFQKDPTGAREWALKVLEAENQEGEQLWILGKLPIGNDSSLDSALLDQVKSGGLKPTCSNQLLEKLIDRGVVGALDIPRSWIPKSTPPQEQHLSRVVFAAQLLLKHGVPKDWPKIRHLIESDSGFGKRLLEGLSFDYRHKSTQVLTALPESELRFLWEWLVRQYPFAEDPEERQNRRGGSVTTRWAMADMRDGLLSSLASLGTPASCTEISRLIKSYPQFAWLREFLARAKEQTRRNTWSPPAPSELFGLSASRANRLVQSADQLLDIVTGALESLQQKLHAETPAAQFLWDGDRPKDEGAISNWVKIELQEALVNRGIILNREVQIHIRERTDIHVDAAVRDSMSKEFDLAKVIIETKGCWNRELKTAMETQLIGRYLRENDCSHGIYLVGWFLCSSWSKADPRLRDLKFKTLVGLRNYVVKQSQFLSSSDRQIRAVVLDASLPWLKPRESKKVRPKGEN